MTTDIVKWNAPEDIIIPPDVNTPANIIIFANSLTQKQKNDIITTFDAKAYDMCAEFVWKRSMIKLKNMLEQLGLTFIGEMLGREDIDEYSNIENSLSDYNAILLAEQLKIISSTGALNLRQSLEKLNHYFSDKAIKDKEQLDFLSALSILKSCVNYILAIQDIEPALKFSSFRKRLVRESLNENDSELEQIINSPAFYIRTALVVLINSFKLDKGATKQHALDNFDTIVPLVWNKMPDKDRWEIGHAYRDVTADGNIEASVTIKKVLLKVSGFDYVPENLRSNTFIKASKALIDIHFGNNNFYNEPLYVKYLAKLGSTIPDPAFIDSIQAYLCVYLGSEWGYSWDAAPIAKSELLKISKSKWIYYFQKIIQSDDLVLSKLSGPVCVRRFYELIQEINVSEDHMSKFPRPNELLFKALMNNKLIMVNEIAKNMYNSIRNN